jgi:hypothetical protein
MGFLSRWSGIGMTAVLWGQGNEAAHFAQIVSSVSIFSKTRRFIPPLSPKTSVIPTEGRDLITFITNV